MENTLRMVIAQKEGAGSNRDERRCREKDDKMLCFTDIQRKTH
jgi:hypothetical protein